MRMTPKLNVIFCDAVIEHAQGSKYSLIGVYPNLVLVETFPYTFSTLVFSIDIVIPASYFTVKENKIPLSVFIKKNNEVLCEIALPNPPQELIPENVSHKDEMIVFHAFHNESNIFVDRETKIFVGLMLGDTAIENQTCFLKITATA